MSYQFLNRREHLGHLIWFLTSQKTLYYHIREFSILKSIIVGKNFVWLWPLECQLQQFFECDIAYLMAHINFWTAGAILIWLDTVFDATFTERSKAIITSFWPLKYHMANITNEFRINRLTSAEFWIDWKISDSKISIFDSVHFLLMC